MSGAYSLRSILSRVWRVSIRSCPWLRRRVDLRSEQIGRFAIPLRKRLSTPLFRHRNQSRHLHVVELGPRLKSPEGELPALRAGVVFRDGSFEYLLAVDPAFHPAAEVFGGDVDFLLLRDRPRRGSLGFAFDAARHCGRARPGGTPDTCSESAPRCCRRSSPRHRNCQRCRTRRPTKECSARAFPAGSVRPIVRRGRISSS